MKFLELAKSRYSCRRYSNKLIDKETIMALLEAARVAPSAANFQPWHFIVVVEKNVINKLYDAYPRDWFKAAPVVIVICDEKNIGWVRSDGKNHSEIDIAIATDHLTLQASDSGLATCWICNFDVNKVKQILELPDGIDPLVLLPVGYPEGEENMDRHLKRKNIEEIIHWNKY